MSWKIYNIIEIPGTKVTARVQSDEKVILYDVKCFYRDSLPNQHKSQLHAEYPPTTTRFMLVYFKEDQNGSTDNYVSSGHSCFKSTNPNPPSKAAIVAIEQIVTPTQNEIMRTSEPTKGDVKFGGGTGFDE